MEAKRQRGYIEDKDLTGYQMKNKEELIKLLQDTQPGIRSIAARMLGLKCNMNDIKITEIILKELVKEKKLYTRIEMAAALEKGGGVTAKAMIHYIGKVGRNQHQSLPERPSAKKSFPLPRDFITRSLARMHTSIMPIMIEVLESEDKAKISEILDAIGYMAFYNLEVAKEEYLDSILKTMKEYEKDEVIYWKGLICLSGFPWSKTEEFLKSVVRENKTTLLVKEAERSLRLLKRPLLDEHEK